MIALVIVILALIAFVGVLMWIVGQDATSQWRERILIGVATLFVTLPPLALAIGAAT